MSEITVNNPGAEIPIDILILTAILTAIIFIINKTFLSDESIKARKKTFDEEKEEKQPTYKYDKKLLSSISDIYLTTIENIAIKQGLYISPIPDKFIHNIKCHESIVSNYHRFLELKKLVSRDIETKQYEYIFIKYRETFEVILRQLELTGGLDKMLNEDIHNNIKEMLEVIDGEIEKDKLNKLSKINEDLKWEKRAVEKIST